MKFPKSEGSDHENVLIDRMMWAFQFDLNEEIKFRSSFSLLLSLISTCHFNMNRMKRFDQKNLLMTLIQSFFQVTVLVVKCFES